MNFLTTNAELLTINTGSSSTGTTVYNTGRGGYNAMDKMTITDLYDNLGNGKKIDISREAEWGTSTVECGYTVSENGRKNAETYQNTVSVGVGSNVGSNYTRLWYMPISNVSGKNYCEGAITFTVHSGSSVSFMAIKCSDFDNPNISWNPGSDVISHSTFLNGHPITVPFCWKGDNIYAIGIKGADSNTSVSVNNWYVKYHSNN